MQFGTPGELLRFKNVQQSAQNLRVGSGLKASLDMLSSLVWLIEWQLPVILKVTFAI